MWCVPEGGVKIAGVDDDAKLITAMNDFSSPSFFGGSQRR
jgi:hypothetical protein